MAYSLIIFVWVEIYAFVPSDFENLDLVIYQAVLHLEKKAKNDPLLNSVFEYAKSHLDEGNTLVNKDEEPSAELAGIISAGAVSFTGSIINFEREFPEILRPELVKKANDLILQFMSEGDIGRKPGRLSECPVTGKIESHSNWGMHFYAWKMRTFQILWRSENPDSKPSNSPQVQEIRECPLKTSGMFALFVRKVIGDIQSD